jgi:glycosyltransferase involved in cell wall biosynthesis/Flp pilus assembly protein TadD
MIVKNEQERLPRCLRSIQCAVDEIVVVDTGSSDKTVQIAEGYGAHVHHHPWQNDFAFHRNQSISYAAGDWIMVIDADEELVSWDDRIVDVMADPSVDSITVTVKNLFPNGQGEGWHNSIRLFRKSERIRYHGKVHNELAGWSRPFSSMAVINHMGYDLNPSSRERKFFRVKTMLEREIEEHPEDPKWRHYLAAACLGNEMYEEAIMQSTTALKLRHKHTERDDFFLWTRFIGAMACLRVGRVGEAERLCIEAIHCNASHIDSHYLLCSIFYDAGRDEEFFQAADQYCTLIRRLEVEPSLFGFMVHNTVRHEWRVLFLRGCTYLKNGDHLRAEEAFSFSFDKCPDMGEFHKHKGLFHLGKMEHSQALTHLEKALEARPDDPDLARARRSVSIAYSDRNGGGTLNATLPATVSGAEPGPHTLSLCMIVKNEESALPSCLDSVKGLVNEIIVVDTGSTDRTVEIAKSYGAKVYSHPWEDHFSKHRNQSIEYATKDWIFILDADETLAPGSHDAVLEAVKNDSIDSLYVLVKNKFDNGRGEAANNSLRIFRNNGIIRYEGRVHNRLVGYTNSMIYPVTIHHEGYNLSPEQNRKKFLRTSALLKRDIEENPSHPRAYHYLAASYLSQNMHREAIEASTQAIFLAEKSGAEDFIYLWSHFIAGFSYLKVGNLDQSERVCEEALKKSPLHLDSHFLLTIVKYHKGDFESSLIHREEFLRLCERHRSRPGDFGPMVHNTIRHGWQVYVYGCLASRHLGKEQEEKRNLLSAEESCPDRFELCQLLAQLLLKESDYLRAEQYLLEALKHTHQDTDIYRTGAQIYNGLGMPDKEEKFLEILTERAPVEPAVLSRLGAICLEQKDYERARGFLEKALSMDPTNVGVLVNLGIVARRTGNTQMALNHLESAITQAPGSVEALSNLAYLYYDLGQLDMARDTFERLLRLDDSMVDAHLSLCLIHTRNGDLEMTIPECERVLDLISLHYDKTIGSVEDLGDVFLEIGKQLIELRHRADAFLAVEVALLLNKSGQLVLKEFAQHCFSKGSYDSCIKSLEKGLRHGTVESDTLQLMGKCYEHLGMAEASELCYQQARSLFLSQ